MSPSKRKPPVRLTPVRRRRLVEAAREARRHSYSPYTKYRVGAALLDQRGRVFAGANVESASAPAGVCAEQSALGAAVSAGARKILALVVLGGTDGPIPPCGRCRQLLVEFGNDIPVIMVSPRGVERETTLGALLPLPFRRK